MRGARTSGWLIAVPMTALALATIYPLLFTTNVAMKTQARIHPRPVLPERFAAVGQLRRRLDERRHGGVLHQLAHSRGGRRRVLLLLGSMAGFALSHIRFRGSRALFLGCLAALFVPFQVIMVPLARTMADGGLIDRYPDWSSPTWPSSFRSRSI
jgi:multiple sugar transport system permease protein